MSLVAMGSRVVLGAKANPADGMPNLEFLKDHLKVVKNGNIYSSQDSLVVT